MNGFNNLPNKSDQNTYIFYANASGSISGSFQAWNIPEYATFLHFTVIGGGGGGGGGCGGTPLASGRSGGGGGAPGGIVAVSIPAILLPKTLYLQVGYGGVPGTGSNSQAVGGQSGQNGTISYICLYPEINPGSTLIQSSNTDAGGGSGGGAGTANAGTAITIADVLNLKWLGIAGNTVAQTAGGNATTTIGSSVTYAGLLTGGAGGGNKQASSNNGSAGGNQIMTSINSYVTTTINGGTGGTNPAAGVDGASGYFSWKPFIATGGAGGGAGSVSANGGNGGKGAYGCGGGGGGAAGVVGGTGGAGGNGLIIITIS